MLTYQCKSQSTKRQRLIDSSGLQRFEDTYCWSTLRFLKRVYVKIVFNDCGCGIYQLMSKLSRSNRLILLVVTAWPFSSVLITKRKWYWIVSMNNILYLPCNSEPGIKIRAMNIMLTFSFSKFHIVNTILVQIPMIIYAILCCNNYELF